jgi:hypothetical protein
VAVAETDLTSESRRRSIEAGTRNLIPFKPGVSGNPGGRPKEDPNLRASCRKLTQQVLDRFEYLLQNAKREDTIIRVGMAILSYGYDLPMQGVKHTGNVGLSVLTPEEKEERLQANLRALAETHPDMVKAVLSQLALPPPKDAVDAEVVTEDTATPNTDSDTPAP